MDKPSVLHPHVGEGGVAWVDTSTIHVNCYLTTLTLKIPVYSKVGGTYVKYEDFSMVIPEGVKRSRFRAPFRF